MTVAAAGVSAPGSRFVGQLGGLIVDPITGRFKGLIDFGDAYISHPALDVWRWRWPDERAAVLAGYTADAPVSEEFMRTWKAVTVTAAALLLSSCPDRGDEATKNLQRCLSEL